MLCPWWYPRRGRHRVAMARRGRTRSRSRAKDGLDWRAKPRSRCSRPTAAASLSAPPCLRKCPFAQANRSSYDRPAVSCLVVVRHHHQRSASGTLSSVLIELLWPLLACSFVRYSISSRSLAHAHPTHCLALSNILNHGPLPLHSFAAPTGFHDIASAVMPRSG